MIKRVIKLFFLFCKIGVFTFGSGYAMIPMLQKEIVDKRKLISNDDILDIVTISESTPGPIAINTATFVGYRIAGVAGAAAATLGVVLPSFVIILTLSFALKQFRDVPVVRYALEGIRAGVLALIFNALYSMYKQCPKQVISYIIAGAAFVFAAFFGVSVIIIIVLSAVFGAVSSYIAGKRTAER